MCNNVQGIPNLAESVKGTVFMSIYVWFGPKFSEDLKIIS